MTLDIDVAGPDDAGSDQLLALMEIAEEIGLPVEAINQTGAYFLRRVDGWRDHLMAVHRGPRASVLRPDVTLYVLLKIGRLSETDLGDCREMLRLSRRLGEPSDEERLRGAIEDALAGPEASERKRVRLAQLGRWLTH